MASSPNWFYFSSPATFFPFAGRLIPWFAAAAILFTVAGLYTGFVIAPDDFQQGSVYRIIFIHVPSAWLSMFLYLVMAVYGAAALIFHTRLSGMMALAIAPTGAWMTVIALATGAIWGRPTWGTYWAWDARMTSELVLLFLYLGVMALHDSFSDKRKADRAAAVLMVVGIINLPVIYFSVRWWNTLHQGASISLTAAPKMAHQMLVGIVLVTLGFWCYAAATSFARVRAIIRERERGAEWIRRTAS